MNAFKVGDKVRCVGPVAGSDALTGGDIYEVSWVEEQRGATVRVKDSGSEINAYFSACRFQPLPTPKEAAEEMKVRVAALAETYRTEFGVSVHHILRALDAVVEDLGEKHREETPCGYRIWMIEMGENL